jgi:hypothetical protein
VRAVLPKYLSVAVLARLSDEGARVALLLLVLQVTGSAAFAGAVIGALMVPHVLAAPAVGALADRVRRRAPLYLLFLAGYGATIAACGLLVGHVPGAVVMIVAATGGCLAPLIAGGLSSLLRELITEDRRARAYGLDVMSYSLAGICGPAIAATLVTWWGPRPAALAVATSAVAAGLIVLTLPLRNRAAPVVLAEPEPEPEPEPAPELAPASGVGGRLLRLAGEGATAIWHIRPLRAVTLATSLGALSMGALPLISALLAVRYHSGYAAGALLSAEAVGGLIGSAVYARKPVGTAHPERVVMLSLVASAVPLLFVPVVPGLPAGLVLFALCGLFFGPQGAALFAARDRHSPVTAHTQVFTIGAGLKYTASALGAAACGLAAGLGADSLLLAVAGCQVAAAGVGTALLRA